jgi:hypothetical protein
MLATVTVKGKIIGQSRAPFPDWSVVLASPGDGTPLTLRELLRRVVSAEVDAFRLRQEERRLTRVLTPAALAEAAVRGKVDLGGHDLNHAVDPEAAVAVALQAFEDGLYFVFVDEQHQQDLDRAVPLREQSEILFLRLIPLAGG